MTRKQMSKQPTIIKSRWTPLIFAFVLCGFFYLLLSQYNNQYIDSNNYQSFNNNNNNNNEYRSSHQSQSQSQSIVGSNHDYPFFPRRMSANPKEVFIQNPLYFANELALHTELINYSYAQETKIRKENFEAELEKFELIGKDLLNGKLDTFEHLSRYYSHPSKYNEYKREYIVNLWQNGQRHISESELVGGHPSCPIINNENDIIKNNINTIEIHFTHNCCKRTQPPHQDTAYKLGKWKTVKHYTMHNLTYGFYNANKHILTQKRGGGYWLWKPYAVLDTLVNHAKACDIVCYCDTGAWWNNTAFPLWHYTSRVKYGIMTFNHLLSEWKYVNITERWYSKRDAFILLGVDYYDMYDTIIRKATFSCYQKNPDSLHFVNEWLYHSQDERIITDLENTFGMNNIPHFSANRHDQTVFSLISKKYGIPAFEDVSQYGYGDVRQWGNIVKHWDAPWIIKHTRGKQ